MNNLQASSSITCISSFINYDKFLNNQSKSYPSTSFTMYNLSLINIIVVLTLLHSSLNQKHLPQWKIYFCMGEIIQIHSNNTKFIVNMKLDKTAN